MRCSRQLTVSTCCTTSSLSGCNMLSTTRTARRSQSGDRVRRHAVRELGADRVAAKNSGCGANDLSAVMSIYRIKSIASLLANRRPGVISAGEPAGARRLSGRIIRIVVPFAPGGGTDVIARALAQEMAKDLGASVIIENKPGAGTIIGTQAVATSEPDGYTLLMGTFANAVNPSLNPKLPYDAAQGFCAGGRDRCGGLLQHRRGQSEIAVAIVADLIAAAKPGPTR